MSFWGDEYSVYYTAVTKEGKGCIARVSSKNLIDWHDEGPVFVSHKLDHPESCNVQKLDEKYLLFFGGHYDWSYLISESPTTWLDCKPVSLKKGITAMEVILRQGERWLVSYFKMNNYRMFLGIIDWSGNNPTIEEIQDKSKLKEFF